MKAIKVDYDVMQSTINCYKRSIETLQSNLNKMNTNMKTLGSEWKGDAKNTFFLNVYQNFEKAMNNDIQHLTFLKEQLEMTRDSLKRVDNKYKKIKIKM